MLRQEAGQLARRRIGLPIVVSGCSSSRRVTRRVAWRCSSAQEKLARRGCSSLRTAPRELVDSLGVALGCLSSSRSRRLSLCQRPIWCGVRRPALVKLLVATSVGSSWSLHENSRRLTKGYRRTLATSRSRSSSRLLVRTPHIVESKETVCCRVGRRTAG